ncbi:protein FAR1-RELATED SEQUENCE 5-like [Primulina eburnea]|uniref:protein FAR1-RELATED SEQUENCE 5-like n=1 Tax=Primulina eburnea TaxID=1245227 RepID=UPI003C6C48DA
MEDNNQLSHEEVKKDYNEEAGNVEVQNEKSFVHVLERLKDEKFSSKRIPVYQKPAIRTQCKAKLKITREKWCEWRVSRFFEEHNHEMFAPDQTHLLGSAHNISHAKKYTLEAMVNAVISVSNAVSFMENEACGPQNLGFIRKAAYDHMSRLKKHTKVENGDVTALIQYFINKANKENYFYWNVQLNDDDRLMNFFFKDYRSKKCKVITKSSNIGSVISPDWSDLLQIRCKAKVF